jgi:hypothetical protein
MGQSLNDTGGSDEDRTRDLPESSSGRSNQIADILSTLLALDLLLSLHGFASCAENLLIN